MSISVCVGCQRLVDRSDMRCPHCGATLRRMTSATLMATFIFGLSIAIAIVAGVLGGIYFSAR